MDPVQIRIDAEVQDALTKILKVRQDFIAFKEDYKKAVSEMSNVSSKFSGDQLTRTATQYMKAIAQFGGVQKLTVSEQAKVNKVLTEAAEKYRLLGREVPEAMQKVIAATAQSATKQQQESQKILSAISGEKLLQQANLTVQAIQKIGGAAALTETQQKKVNDILTEAAAKYKALGQVVPAEIQKIIAETTKIKLARDEFEKLRNSLTGQTIQREAQAYIKVINDIGGAVKLTSEEQKKALDVLTKYEAKLVASGKAIPESLRKITAELRKLQPAKDDLKKLEDSLSGKDVIRNANAYVQVIQRIGGVTKLTADEQKKVNQQLTETAAKYRALGQIVPAEIQKILNQTRENGNSTSSFFNQLWFQIAKGSTVGNLAANTISAAWRTVKDAVAGAVEQVIEFGKRGADVQRVRGAFEALVPTVQRVTSQGIIGETPQRLINSARTALRGLATDFEIMSAANKAVLFGIPVTAEQFGILARSAITLGRAMNIDAGKALDDLIIALGRTSPRILDNLGIIVKVTEANEKYAKQLGKNRLELTSEERVIAFSNEALSKMNERVKDLGDVQLNFADRLVKVRNNLRNVYDEIGTIIAVNPVLNKAIERSGEIFMTAFGPTRHAQVQLLTKIITEMSLVTVKVIGDVALPVIMSLIFSINLAMVKLTMIMAEMIYDADRALNILGKLAYAIGKIPGPFQITATAIENAALAGRQAIKDFLPDPKEMAVNAAKMGVATTKLLGNLADTTAGFKDLYVELEKLRNAPPLKLEEVFPSITNNDFENSIETTGKTLTKAEAAWIDAFERSKQKYVEEWQELVRWFDVWVLKHEKQRNDYNQVILDRLSSQNVNKVLGPGGTEELRRSQEEYDRINARGTKGIVDILKQTDTFTTKIVNLPKLKGEFTKAFTTIFSELPQVISRAIQGGGNISKAITTTIFGSLGKEMFNTTEGFLGKGLAKLTNKLGPTLGKTIGSAIPFVGEMLGQLAGVGVSKLIEGLKKPGYKDSMKVVGREWGISISEELAKSIEETSKKKFKGDRRSAELFHMGDILKEGGLNDANFNQMLGKLRDVFSMVEQGKFSLADATKVLDENFGLFAEHLNKSGKLASKQFLELIELNEKFKTNSAAVAEYINGQTARLGAGLAKMTASLSSKYKEVADKVKTAKDELDKVNEEIKAAEASGGDRVGADLLERRRRAQEELNTILESQKKGISEAREEFERLGRISLAAFNGLEKKGLTTSQILEQLGPSFQNLVELQKALGIESSNAAVQELLNLQAKRDANKELFEAAGAVNETATAMANLNLLDQETFNDLAAQAAATKEQFQAVGLTEKQALSEIAPFLRTALELERERGIILDDNTRSLIDQAAAHGVLGETAKSEADIMKEGFDGVKDGLAALIETLGGTVPDSLKRMADAAITESQRARSGLEEVETGAADAAKAVEDISYKMGDVADSMGDVDFETWAADASRALESLSEDVDAVSFGHSPGGLKEIPIKAAEAVDAFRAMMRDSGPELNELYELVSAINPTLERASVPQVQLAGNDETVRHLEEIKQLLPMLKSSLGITINGTIVQDGEVEEFTERKVGPFLIRAIESNRNNLQTKMNQALDRN